MNVLAALVVLTAACGDNATARSVEQLRDPATCIECHPQHVAQWAGSMHAYASDDPVFVAMNRRGQRETSGQLGDFCVKCHAPMAVALGLANGSNFDPAALPAEARGITCYFCHNIAEVTEDHNNGLVLANDQTMRGGAMNPVTSPAHFSKYDEQMDSDSSTNQSKMCGSCHDILVPERINGVAGGVALERTFAEWRMSFLASDPNPKAHLTCGGCHMISKTDLIADAPGLEVVPRPDGYHEHRWPGIDQALDAFVDVDAQAAAIKRDLDPAVRIVGPLMDSGGIKTQYGGICLDPDGLKIRIDNLGAGHAVPSGASQDRRLWLEVTAFAADGTLVFSSGVVAEGQDPLDTPGEINVATFGAWDRAFRADNSRAHMFWDVARIASQPLKLPLVRGEDHSTTVKFQIAGANLIDRIETRLLIRPLSFELLADLEASSDLAPGIAAKMNTLVVGGGSSTWTRATSGMPPAEFTNCNPR